MSEEFGNDLITISDDEGNDYTLEHLCSLEIDDDVYMAFLPVDMDEEDDDYGFVILKAQDDYLVSIDDDKLLEELYDAFMETLYSEEDNDED